MKKLASLLLSAALLLSLAACGGPVASGPAASTPDSSEAAASSEAASSGAASSEAEENTLSTADPVRIAGLKGPTTMGLVNLLPMQEGVLYVVEKGDTVQSVADLAGRTILSTGKGTTPEYVLRYILTQNGIDPDQDVTIEFYSEAAEVTAQMAVAEDAIAVLPQPYVTSASMQDDTLRVALDLTAEWEKVCDTQLITGVTVVRTAYAEEHPDVVAAFLEDYAASAEAASADLDGTAALCEEQGVVAKAAIAKAALPACNIVCITGEEMKADVAGYAQVLYDADPAAVGGAMPDDGFYWM